MHMTNDNDTSNGTDADNHNHNHNHTQTDTDTNTGDERENNTGHDDGDADNPFDDALATADADTQGTPGDTKESVLAALAADYDADAALDELEREIGEGKKSETIGLHVSPMMKAVYDEFQQSDDVDVDVLAQLRQHLMTLARRHPEVVRRAELKRRIDEEL